MGSGQTALAAIKAGRNYEGYEIKKEYCDLAEKRIDEIKLQKKLTIDNFDYSCSITKLSKRTLNKSHK